MLEELKKAARTLAYMYRGLKEWKRREAEAAEAYKATLAYRAYQEVVAARKSLQALTKESEGHVRRMVLAVYAIARDKKTAPGLGVRESKGKASLVYDNKASAVQWLEENAPVALMPDPNVVMGMLEAGHEIPGVRIVNEGAGALTATITGAAKLIDLYLKED